MWLITSGRDPRSKSYPNTTELAGFMKVNGTPVLASWVVNGSCGRF
jgi:hypothetical protein